MNKKTLLLMGCLFYALFAVAQSLDADLQNKYFNARNRLKKWFVTVGSEPGQSLPTEQITMGWPPNYLYQRIMLRSNGTDSFISESGWKANKYNNDKYTQSLGSQTGDNPLIMLGDYISVLSTEYWLLKHYQKEETEDFKAVLNELYFALASIDRLDGTAEKYFNKNIVPSSADYNGFLRRDDMADGKENHLNEYYGHMDDPINGELNMAKYHTRGPVTPDTTIEYFDSVPIIGHIKVKDTMTIDTIVIGSIITFDTSFFPIIKDTILGISLEKKYKYYKNKYRLLDDVIWRPDREDGVYDKGAGRVSNECSMDEFIGILMGLKFLQKFVDEGANAKPRSTDSLKYLIPWSRDIANRMMLYISKETDDIRALDPEAYEERQKIACAKDRCHGRKKDFTTSNGKLDPAKCPECTKRELYSQYTSAGGHGSVYNPIIFKKGNYVLTNPAANNRIVHRGPYAFPYGYPIEKLGETLASSPGHAKDYPGTSLTLDDEEQAARYITDVVSPVLMPFVITGVGYVWYNDELFGGDKTVWDNLSLELTGRCGGLPILGIEGTSLCLTGHALTPSYPSYWQALWEHMGDSSKVLNKIWCKYANDGGSANIMAAKLAACTGTWEQRDFAHFSNKCGFPMMSLIYDVLNDKTPQLSKTYYQSILNTMDCQGSSGTAYPFDRDVLGGAAMKPSVKDQSFVNSRSFRPNFDYMLYYNLYRIAEIQNWGNSLNNYDDQSCPCYFDTILQSTKLMASAIEPKKCSVVLHKTTGNDTVGGYDYKSIQIQSKKLVKTKNANPEHARYGVRNHEILNHFYRVNNTQTFEVTRDLVVCNANLQMNPGSKLIIDSTLFENSPNELVIRKNGALLLGSNAQLIVKNGSRVVIDVGGKLQYNEGARIILNGPNAVLHIKGGLVLGTYANFQIEGGNLGKGYVIWENNWVANPYQYVNTATIPTNGTLVSPYGASAALVANNTNSITFTNPTGAFNGSGNLALECRGNLGLMTGWGLGKLEIKNCRVNLGAESRIVSECANTQITNVDVYGHYTASSNPKYDYKRTSMGLHILGRKNAVSNVKVWDCYQGMKIFNVGTYQPLTLNNVNFENCLKGIVNEGGRLIYNNGTINTSGPVQMFSAIEGVGTQGISNIYNVQMYVPNYQWLSNKSYTFHTGEYASCLKSHGTGQYFLLKSKLNDADKAIELREGFARPVCSEIGNNRWAVDLLQTATFNVANKTYNTYDMPAGAIPNIDKYGLIKGRQDNYLLLNEAENSFYGVTGSNQSFIDVVLHSRALTEPTNAGNNWHPTNAVALPARGSEWKMYAGSETDIWPLNSATPNVSLYKLVNGNPANLDLSTRATLNGSTFSTNKSNTCPIYYQNKKWTPTQTQMQPWINGDSPFGMGSANLPGEVYSMLYVWQQNNGLPQVLGQLKITLDTLVDDSFAPALHEIYVATHGLYREVFSDTTIPDSARPQRENDVYNLMLDLQTSLLSRSQNMDDPYRWFKFELDRDLALIHRSFNHRNDGINHLNNVIPTYANPNEQQALLAWKCILEREQLYLDTLVPYDSVFIYGCVPNYYFDDSSHNFALFGYNPELWGENGGEPNAMAIQTGSQKAANGTTLADLKTNVQTKVSTPTNKEISLALYPNPADNSFTLYCSEAISKVRVTDNAGRLVNTYQVNGKNQISIDASTYSKGIYFVETYTLDKRFVRQLMINR